MQISTVSRPNPMPPAWANLLGGMVQGGAGQIALNQAQQQKQQEDQMQLMRALLPAFANQNRDITSVPVGTAGSMPYGL